MNNPWLDISEADYVGHMSSAAVGQRPVLSRLLGEALQNVQPHALLVLGCSTGNGLEHINPAITSRVVVVDVNPEYLRRLSERFPDPMFTLDVRCGDLTDMELEREAYDMVHVALLFEYLEWPLLLPRLVRCLRPGAVLNVVLQARSASTPAVTPTAFTSLRQLESVFRFVEPTALVQAARRERLMLSARRTEPLPAGKAFEVLRFIKVAV